jgi:hypothetical protein
MVACGHSCGHGFWHRQKCGLHTSALVCLPVGQLRWVAMHLLKLECFFPHTASCAWCLIPVRVARVAQLLSCCTVQQCGTHIIPSPGLLTAHACPCWHVLHIAFFVWAARQCNLLYRMSTLIQLRPSCLPSVTLSSDVFVPAASVFSSGHCCSCLQVKPCHLLGVLL